MINSFIVSLLIEEKLIKHSAVEEEQKQLKSNVKSFKELTADLVYKAKEKIIRNQAEDIIMKRFHETLKGILSAYMKQHLMGILSYIENLWDKYKVTAREIETERDKEAAKLNEYLTKLGYMK